MKLQLWISGKFYGKISDTTKLGTRKNGENPKNAPTEGQSLSIFKTNERRQTNGRTNERTHEARNACLASDFSRGRISMPTTNLHWPEEESSVRPSCAYLHGRFDCCVECVDRARTFREFVIRVCVCVCGATATPLCWPVGRSEWREEGAGQWPAQILPTQGVCPNIPRPIWKKVFLCDFRHSYLLPATTVSPGSWPQTIEKKVCCFLV